MAAFWTVARLVNRGLIAPSGALATDDLTSPQLADYAHALHAWNPTVVEESDYRGKKRAELTAFLKRYAAAPELKNRVRSADPKASVERIADHLAEHTRNADGDGDGASFRTVARLLRKGHLAPNGALLYDDDITMSQLVDYARALRAWNPDVVEESDYKGRSRAEVTAFLRRYASVPALTNRVRTADPDASLERVIAHLVGVADKATPRFKASPRSKNRDKEEKERERERETVTLADIEEAAAREEQHKALDERRREALDKHREVRVKRDALRNQIHTILMLQIRRRNVEAELERASARVAALAADIMKSDDNDDVVESHALEDCDAVEGHVNALQSELDALREDEAGLPTGDLDAIIAGLVNETHYLDEEQTLLQDRVTKADIAIMMGGFEAK